MMSSKSTWARRTGAVLVSLIASVALLAIGAGQSQAAEFGVEPGSFEAEFVGPNAEQAGAAADFHFGFRMNRRDAEADPHTMAGSLKDLNVDLPRGIVTNPTPFEVCSLVDVNSLPSGCPATAAVGMADLRIAQPGYGYTTQPVSAPTTQLFRVAAHGDEAAAFAFNAANLLIVRMGAHVSPEGDYRIRTTAENITELSPMYETQITLWGVPTEHQGPGPYGLIPNMAGYSFGGPLEATAPRERFLSVPARCEGAPLRLDLTMDPWTTPIDSRFEIGQELPMPTGCDQLNFSPSLKIEPEHTRAAKPAGYAVTLKIPQNDDPVDGLETPLLKDAVVTMPEGVAISPGQADGLEACTDDQFGVDENTKPACPPASKIGEIKIDTPVLDGPLTGNVFIGSQIGDDPESGQMYRLFVSTRAAGVRVKFLGNVSADKNTGQLTTSFTDNPELPFEKLTLSLKGGPRGVLANPASCGTYQGSAELTPYSGGDPVSRTSSFTIDEGPDGGACEVGDAALPGDPADLAGRSFDPEMRSGVVNPVAASSSPFVLRLTRSDGDQEIDSLTVSPPEGVTSVLKSAEQCSDQDIVANDCPESSKIGTTIVGAGTGSNPFYVTGGEVFLAGPYKGAPLSLDIQVPAIAGPFDLGIVNVRSQVEVDKRTAQLTITSDPLPQILKGTLLRIKDLRVLVDKPGFMLAPSSCSPMSVNATVNGINGAEADLSNRFQVGDCAHLDFSPKLNLEYKGKGSKKRNAHPRLAANLKIPQDESNFDSDTANDTTKQTNIKRVRVVLPRGTFLDQGALSRVCTPAQWEASDCPEDSKIGNARAWSPILAEPLKGPVYLKVGPNELPDLAADLDGIVDIDLFGKIDQSKGRIRNTFQLVPDVPVSQFRMNIRGGNGGLLVNSKDICKGKKALRRADVAMNAHNGAKLNSKQSVVKCGKR